jgi:WD40 repeat protein
MAKPARSLRSPIRLALAFAILAAGLALPMSAANERSPMAVACRTVGALRAEAQDRLAEGQLLFASRLLSQASGQCARQETAVRVERAEVLAELGDCDDAEQAAKAARAAGDLRPDEALRLSVAAGRCEAARRPRTDDDRKAQEAARASARRAELEGRWADAARAWSEAWDRGADDPMDLVRQGASEGRAGRSAASVRAYERALRAWSRASRAEPTTDDGPSDGGGASIAVTATHVLFASDAGIGLLGRDGNHELLLAGVGEARVVAADGSAWLERREGALVVVSVRTGTVTWRGPADAVVSAGLAGPFIARLEDTTLHVTDMRTGRDPIEGQSGTATFAFSGDGSRIAVLSNEGELHVRETASGARLLTVSDATAPIALSDDGARLVFARPAGTEEDPRRIELRVVDAKTGALAHMMRGHFQTVHSVALSRGGRYLLTTSPSSTRVRDLEAGREVLRLDEVVGAAAFSPEGTSVTVAGLRGIATYALASGGRVMEAHRPPLSAHVVTLAPDGRRLAAVVEHRVRVVSLPDLEPVCSFEAGNEGPPEGAFDMHPDLYKHLAFSPDGQRIAVTSPDRSPQVHDATTGALLYEVSAPDQNDWRDVRVAFSPDGTLLLAITKGEAGALELRRFDGATGTSLSVTSPKDATEGVAALSKDGRWVAMGGGSSLVVFATDGSRGPFPVGGQPFALHFSATAPRLWTVEADTLRLWDLLTGTELASGPRVPEWSALDEHGVLRASERPPVDGELFAPNDFDEAAGLVTSTLNGNVILTRRGSDDTLTVTFSSRGGLVARNERGWIATRGDATVPYRCAIGDAVKVPWEVCASVLRLDDPARVLAPVAPGARALRR